jgi:hypothetical protein
MLMNRRQALLGFAGMGLGFVWPLPEAKARPKKEYEFFTHNELMLITEQVRADRPNWEVLDLDAGMVWQGEPQTKDMLVYIAIMRMSNCLHRRTLVGEDWWLVTHPSVLADMDEWSPYKHSYTWGRKGEEVTPGVTRMGTMGNRWAFYTDERFPRDLILGGIGFKTVTKYRYEKNPKAQSFPDNWNNPIPEDFGFKVTAYKGPPTTKYYGLIELKGTR